HPFGQHDIAQQRYGIGLHVENSRVAGRNLLVLANLDTAPCLQPLDPLLPGWSRLGGRQRVRRAPLAVVENREGLGAHRGVALYDLYAAGERRDLVLVADLELRCIDFHRLIAILRESLQRVGGSAWRLLRRWRLGVCQRHEGHGRRHRQTETCEGVSAHGYFFSLSGGGSTRFMTTPPLKRMTSPRSSTSRRLALSVPLSIFSSTGLCDTMLPFLTSITASRRWPEYPEVEVRRISRSRVSRSNLDS